jgi:two-component system, OmpR family, sensor kinase
MGREAERMRVLVLDLLTLARLDAGRPAQPETLDLSALVAHILDEGVPGMPAAIDRQLGDGVLANTDRNAAATIVRNLLVNACKYAPGAAQTWRTWTADQHAYLELRDEGPGISAADLPHIFERFYRGEKTRAREEGGSGLGLSIVQGLARTHRGDVSISSTEGRGTTVTVWFPAVAAPPPPPPPITG